MNNWINVKKQLPEISDIYKIKGNDKIGIYIECYAYYNVEDGLFYSDINITHWGIV
jgi:hypothetical protein